MIQPPKNLTHKRKQHLEEIAEWIIEDYFDEEEVIKPETIAKLNGITYSDNDYNGDFKALIECKNSKFHIFLHFSVGENLNTTHVRYSFAHELGHYFIYEHYLELMNLGFLPNNSNSELLAENIFEKEAEFFASCFLMPRSRIIKDINADHFNIDTILNICSKYQVSLSAALSRYMALSSIPIMVVFTYIDGTYNYHLKSKDFPFYALNLSSEEQVPAGSKACDCCFNTTIDYTSAKINLAEVWFNPKNEKDKLRAFSEHCFQQPALGRIVSVIWEVL